MADSSISIEGISTCEGVGKEDPINSSEYETDSEGELSEEEEEPKLKYERVRGDVTTLLERDSLTSIVSNDKMMVLGTMGGGVVILDHLGYRIQHRRPHVAPVLHVALSGDYWASAGKDKKVVVQGILSSENNHVVTLDLGTVTCVALDPSFGQSRPKTRFAVAHTSGLTLYERTLFSNYRPTVLTASAGGSIGASLGLTGGAVRGVSWCGSLLAWATDVSVRVFDLNLKTTIALVQRDHSAALDSVQFPPHLHWSSEELLLIGWADSIKVCRVKERPKPSTQLKDSASPRSSSPSPSQLSASRRSSTASIIASYRGAPTNESYQTDQSRPGAPVPTSDGSSQSHIFTSSIVGVTGGYSPTESLPLDLPPRLVEIEMMFTTEFYICGLAMLDDDTIIALTYNKTPSLESSRSSPTDTKGPQQFTDDPFEWRRPQLRLLQPRQRSYEEISKDILGTHRYKDYLPLHYKLERVSSGDRWYVLSPRDLVAVKPREPSDSLEWLLEHHKFSQAMDLLEREGGVIGRHTEESVGKDYLNYLLECQLYSDAAKLATRVVNDDIPCWRELVKVFANAGQMGSLHHCLPCSQTCHLPLEDYDFVLQKLLDADLDSLVCAVQKWPSWCYSVNKLVGMVLHKVALEKWNVPLLQTLAHLYSHQQNHEKALAIYLKLEHKDIFGLIKKHGLYSSMALHAPQLMALDTAVTVELCMKRIEFVPPNDMVSALTGCPQFLFKYLNALYDTHKDLCTPHHNLLLRLLAENKEEEKLMNFLKCCPKYNLDEALTVCKDHGLLHHTVYLLERTGNTQDALSLVLLEANDLDWAINLCKDHNDAHLWATLVDNTISDPNSICPLLRNAGKYAGEASIIQRIPEGLRVEGLIATVNEKMAEVRKNRDLHKGCEKLFQRDIVRLVQRRKCEAKRAVVVGEATHCEGCGAKVVGLAPTAPLMAFKCCHIYHKHCMPDTATPSCSVCALRSNVFG